MLAHNVGKKSPAVTSVHHGAHKAKSKPLSEYSFGKYVALLQLTIKKASTPVGLEPTTSE